MGKYSWETIFKLAYPTLAEILLSDPIPLSAKISQNCFQLLTTTKLVCIISSADRFVPRPFYLPLLALCQCSSHFSFVLKKKKCSCNLWNIKIIFIYLKIPIFKFANSKHWLQILANQQEIERYFQNFYLYLLWIVD